jgi:hypothetical protein
MRVLVLAGLVVLMLSLAGPAAGASTCAKRVIDDWYDNGRVDGTYPVHCYDDAIDALPRDVRDYSSAKDDIQRALQARLRDEPAPPATNDPSPETPNSNGEPGAGGAGGGNGDDGSNKPGEEGGPEVIGSEVDTAASDSVPIPLLVLAGLALLLVAAGSIGYLVRRLQARRISQPPAA